jgi:hypothetical protein
MKIGDLFIALGFKVTGREQFQDAEKGMHSATLKASALALAVNAINYAFLRMMDAARASAVEMKNFSAATGLSADELKKWQAAGVVNDVQAKEMTTFVEGLQQRVSEIQLGRGNIAPFQMLGVLPSRDTFGMLKQISTALRQLPPDIARVAAADLGANEAMVGFLRQQNLQLDSLERHFRMREKDTAALIGFNRAWQDFKFKLSAARDVLAAAFAPALAGVVKVLTVAVDWLARFATWLNTDTTGAKVARNSLVALMGVMGLLGIALAGLAAMLAAVSTAMAAMDLAAVPVLASLVGIAAAVGAIVAGLALFVLAIEDFSTAAQGGKSFFDWNEGLLFTLKNAERLATVIEKLIDLNEKMSKGAGGFFNGLMNRDVLIDSLFGPKGSAGGSTVNVKHDTKITVDGAQSPRETGRAVAEEFERSIGGAAYQMPLPNH